MNPTDDFFQQSEALIKKVLKELRPKLLDGFGSASYGLKSDNSIVTELDLLVEERLRAELGKFNSSIGFTGEETGGGYDKSTYWLVDPIDGTEVFSRGMPFSTNMIALVHDNKPVMSVIYNFFSDEYYVAIKGSGAFKNGVKISVSDRKISRAVIAANINNQNNPKIRDIYDRLGQKFMFMPIRVIASGYEYALVAQGSIEGRVSFNAKEEPHDFAPGMLLVEEAGGVISNVGSDDYNLQTANGIAANKYVYKEISGILNQYI